MSFNPALNFNSAFTLATSVSDGVVPSITGSRAFTGTAANDAPTANAQSVATNEDAAKAITLTGSDVDGNPLAFTVTGNPARQKTGHSGRHFEAGVLPGLN